MKERIHENCDFTIEQLNKFLHARRVPYEVTLEQILEYWKRKNWCTRNGEKVGTLQVAINVPNAYVVQQRRAHGVVGFDNILKKKDKEGGWINKKSPYCDQLDDPKWKAYREFIFIVRGRKCEVCGKPSNLNIHHRVYINNRYAWEYLPNEVMVVCSDCHRYIHNIGKNK